MKTNPQIAMLFKDRAQALIDAGVPLSQVAHTLTLASGCRDRYRVIGNHVTTSRGYSVLTGERVIQSLVVVK
jgi:hypothetical protein